VSQFISVDKFFEQLWRGISRPSIDPGWWLRPKDPAARLLRTSIDFADAFGCSRALALVVQEFGRVKILSILSVIVIS